MTLELTREQNRRLKLLLNNKKAMCGNPLDIAIVEKIKKEIEDGLNTAEIARNNNVSTNIVNQIKSGRYRSRHFQ